MRILKLNLLAVALLLFGATNASAFAINMVARNSTTSLDVSDTVTVDVFFDATGIGIKFLSVAVLNSSASLLTYDPIASAAVSPKADPGAPGTSGAEPSYILYSAMSGSGMTALPAVYLLPQQTPAWLTWPAPPVGQEQVNINYAEANIIDTFDTRATGLNIWIATLVFHVDVLGTEDETLALSLTSGGNIFQIGDVVQPPGTIALSAPITLTFVPEPTTAVLIGLGLLGLAISGRRQS